MAGLINIHWVNKYAPSRQTSLVLFLSLMNFIVSDLKDELDSFRKMPTKPSLLMPWDVPFLKGKSMVPG